MQESNRLTDPQREFEMALRSSLAPTAVRVDPIAAAFAAGRQSQRRQMRYWQAAAGIVLLAGAGMWFIPAQRDTTPSIDRMNPSFVSQTQSPSRLPLSDQSLLKLQQAVQQNGFQDLPPAHLPAPKPLRISDML